MADRRFHCLSAPEPATLLLGQRLVLTAMDNLHLGFVTIHTAKIKINHHFFLRAADIFEQDAGLLELYRENMTVVGIAEK